jgi:5-methylcytosine-specific restriction endonuclease McrA
MPCELCDISRTANIPDDECSRAVDALVKYEMVSIDENGVFSVNDWETYRYPEGKTSNKRVSKYRERKKANGYGQDDHRRYEEVVRERDGNACVYCGSPKDLVMDHAIPVQLGGEDVPLNLMTACRSCNAGKAGRTPEQAGMAFLNKDAEAAYRKYVKKFLRKAMKHIP